MVGFPPCACNFESKHKLKLPAIIMILSLKSNYIIKGAIAQIEKKTR